MSEALLSGVAHALAAYAIAGAIGGLLLTASAAWIVLRHRRDREVLGVERVADNGVPPPVTVVLVADDEDGSIGERLDALAALDYPAFEVVVVSNGPISAPLAKAMARLQTEAMDLIYRPLIKTGRVTGCYHAMKSLNLVVLEKERGATADAFNAGLNAARSPYVCLVETGTWLDRAALQRLMTPVMLDPERVVLVAGIVRVMNGCGVRDGDVVVGACPARPVVTWAVLDGLRRALLAVGASPFWGAGLAPRHCILVQKREVFRLGGVPQDGGVADLAVVPWSRAGLASAFVSLPVAWTMVPTTLRGVAEVHGHRVGDALASLRTLRLGASGSSGLLALLRFVRGAWTWTPPLDLAALMVGTIAFQLGLLDFDPLLAVWTSVLVGRTAVSSAAILVHDVTPKRYPSAADVSRLFAATMFDLLVVRVLSAWWTVRAVWRRIPVAASGDPSPIAARVGQQS